MNKLRVLLIGTGYIAQAEHIPNWRLSEYGTVGAVVDTREEMARAVGEDCGVPWYTDVETALRESGCEAVHICTPAQTHVPIIEQAVKHGLHVMVEKPLAENPEDAQRAVDAARAAGVVLMVGYPRFFDADFRQLGQWLKQGDIGRLLGVQSVWKLSLPGVYRKVGQLPRTTLIQDKEVPLVESLKYRLREESIHHLSLLRSWLGEPVRVEAVLGNVPLWHVSLTFSDQVPVWHTNASPTGHGEEIWLYGEEGYGYAKPWSPHFPWTFGHAELFNRRDGMMQKPAIARLNPYAAMLDEFALSIREGRQPTLLAQDAVDDLRLVERIADAFLHNRQNSQ